MGGRCEKSARVNLRHPVQDHPTLTAVVDSNGFVNSFAVVVVDLDEEPSFGDGCKHSGRHWHEILATGLTREASQRVADEWNVKQEASMLVKLVWPDGRIEEIEHASVNPTTTVLEVPHRGPLSPGHYDPSKMTLHVHGRQGDPDVVTSVENYGAPVHRFRRIHVGNVDTGDIHALWVHADTDVHVVKRVVDAVAAEKGSSST